MIPGVRKFFYANPSFLSGAARALDLGATFDSYNDHLDTETVASLAIYNAWRDVGDALWGALGQEMTRNGITAASLCQPRRRGKKRKK